MHDLKKHLKVWDLPTRVFHWSLVSLVALGLITGFVSPESWMGIHVWAGYGIVLLVVFRLVWGIFGSEFSRIETFSFTPKELLIHINELIFLRPRHYIGHNPAGALMIFALIFFLIGISASGLLALGGEENQGPLAGAINFQIGDMASEVHTILVLILIALICCHIIGVIVEIYLSGENLVKSMIDGYKVIPEGKAAPKIRPSRPIAALSSLLIFAILAGTVLWAFSTMPPSGIIKMTANSDYAAECGDCHEVYHPSLLPQASWTKLMVDLEDHFGEDASLDQDVINSISDYLSIYASEAWDTEASNRFSKISQAAPYQISATPYWQRKHADIDLDVFKRKGVGGKSRCLSCHSDAAIGYFDDQNINTPEQ